MVCNRQPTILYYYAGRRSVLEAPRVDDLHRVKFFNRLFVALIHFTGCRK